MPGLGELIVLMMIVVILPLTVFWIYAIIDCAKYENGPGHNQLAWMIVLVLGGVIGAAVYWFVRRPQRVAQLGR